MTAQVSQLPTARSKHPAGKAVTGPVWLSPAQVCERVPGMTEEILTQRRVKNLPPQFFKPSQKTVIYELSVIDEWVRSTASTPRK